MDRKQDQSVGHQGNLLLAYFGRPANNITLIALLIIFLSSVTALFPLIFILLKAFGGGRLVSVTLAQWTDARNTLALRNSLIIAAVTGAVLPLAATTLAIVIEWAAIKPRRLLYPFCFISLLIPDYVAGIAGRAAFDPSFGILASWLPESLLLERGSALTLVAGVTIVKWLAPAYLMLDAFLLVKGSGTLRQVKLDFASLRHAILDFYIPTLRPAIFLVAALGFLIGFRQQELAYELTSGGAGFTAELWAVWNYRVLFEFGDIARAAAQALFSLFVILGPLLLIRRFAGKAQ